MEKKGNILPHVLVAVLFRVLQKLFIDTPYEGLGITLVCSLVVLFIVGMCGALVLRLYYECKLKEMIGKSIT